ncbi:MAG: type II toxin-antitoxin system PemK/MazF family toxin [Acidaminococcaceae bacterium]|nr:type II toxin-antitoxin system PemK/MazF family toxin [Acidaminococcaceae bacterium]
MILPLSKYQHLVTLGSKVENTTVRFHVFPDIDSCLEDNPELFSGLLKEVQPKIKVFQSMQYIESKDYKHLQKSIDATPLGRNATPMFLLLYAHMIAGKSIDFGAISESSAIKLCEFAATYGKLLFNLNFLNSQMNRDFITASNVLKASFLQRSIKEFYILQKWLLDWAKYLLKEKTFTTVGMPHFKQGDIVRVDFGWRIGQEMGGIHYAIVIESNNNPKSVMILLTPISSYDLGYKIHPTNVDLGKCVGDKYSFAVLNQTGSYSKMRILDHRIYGRIQTELLKEILKKIHKKFGMGLIC